MSDLDVSVSESSYADARADTPTIGNENRSDSEDTLSSLSFDENGILSPDPDNRSPGSPGSGILMPETGPILTSPPPGSNALFPVASPRTHKTTSQSPSVSQLPRSTPESPRGTTTRGGKDRNKSSGVEVRVSVTDVDMDEESSLHLDLPPGVAYQPPSIDFPSSPSQLKLAQGPSFMPKEDVSGAVSEDDTSFASNCRAHLDLNFRNGGAVRLTKKEEYEGTPEPESQQDRNNRRNLSIPGFQDSFGPTSVGPESLVGDVLEDYIEDFYLPMSHESVMSRQQSFRRKVQKTLETAAADSAIRELNKFENMLSSYDEEDPDHDQGDHSSLGDGSETVLEFSGDSSSPQPMKTSTPECDVCLHSRTPCNACQSTGKLVKTPGLFRQISSIDRDGSPEDHTILSSESSGNKSNIYNPETSLTMQEWDSNIINGVTYGRGDNARYDRRNQPRTKRILDFESMEEPQSLLDIDALCNRHAPNLMRKAEDEAPQSIMTTNGEEYFIPRATLDKLSSVYDSTNFHNLYTLSGELKHILSPMEIEELVANREHLETMINPEVMAALSWSLNEVSLPQYDLSLVNKGQTKIPPSKTSSISNGFHSRNTSDNSDDEGFAGTKPNSPDPPKDFQRGAPQTASFRRRIAVAQSLAAAMAEIPKQAESTQDDEEIRYEKNLKHVSDLGSFPWKSLESLDNLEIEDDIESGGGSGGSSEKNSTFGDDSGSAAFLVRRDSKRFGKKNKEDRVIQGLFVESKNSSNNGTLKRIRVPLQFSEDGTRLDFDFDSTLPGTGDDAKSKQTPKRRISVDSKILSAASNSELDDGSQATDIEYSQSEAFHSCFTNTYKEDDDPTIRSDSGSNEADEITLDLDTPDDMADSILGKLDSKATSPAVVNAERIPELTAAQELEDERCWRSFRVGVNEIQIDLKAIQPYRRVLSHGGYFDAEKRIAIILFSGCYLPDRSRREYSYLMDHLFLYVLSTLEELIVDDYILVYLHGAAPRQCQPTFNWLKRCYQLIDRKLRKNLKALYLVHPSLWLRTVVAISKPFISTKFSQKIQFVHTLADLCLELPTEHLVIPEPVLQYDFDSKVTELKRQKQME